MRLASAGHTSPTTTINLRTPLMKIAEKPPVERKSAVKITQTCYELFICPPVSLGTINKKGDYWYTADGMRFISNRDAIEYLKKGWEHQQAAMKAAFTPSGAAAAAAAQAAIQAAEDEQRRAAEEKRRRREEEDKKRAAVVPPVKPAAPTPEEIAYVLTHLQNRAKVVTEEASRSTAVRKRR